MNRLTRDGTAEPVSRDQILRHARGQGNIHFPCSADHEQDWQPYSVDPYSAMCDDHTYIDTYLSRAFFLRNLVSGYRVWEGLSGRCRVGITLEICSQLAIFATQPIR